ncbi:MAG: hypothetical protein LKF99_04390 [Bifidobacterium sp.]|jgi:hypothetical protein|nr:hypothetical protein [Bifidobacterium sp.]
MGIINNSPRDQARCVVVFADSWSVFEHAELTKHLQRILDCEMHTYGVGGAIIGDEGGPKGNNWLSQILRCRDDANCDPHAVSDVVVELGNNNVFYGISSHGTRRCAAMVAAMFPKARLWYFPTMARTSNHGRTPLFRGFGDILQSEGFDVHLELLHKIWGPDFAHYGGCDTLMHLQHLHAGSYTVLAQLMADVMTGRTSQAGAASDSRISAATWLAGDAAQFAKLNNPMARMAVTEPEGSVTASDDGWFNLEWKFRLLPNTVQTASAAPFAELALPEIAVGACPVEARLDCQVETKAQVSAATSSNPPRAVPQITAQIENGSLRLSTEETGREEQPPAPFDVRIQGAVRLW